MISNIDWLIVNSCKSHNWSTPTLYSKEWKRLDKNVGLLQQSPIYIDDTPGMSIFELRTKARRLVREKGVELIMIDYLQLMNASGARFGSRQEEVSTISRSLKGLAKELDALGYEIISTGGTHKVLAEAGIVKQRKQGNMYFQRSF